MSCARAIRFESPCKELGLESKGTYQASRCTPTWSVLNGLLHVANEGQFKEVVVTTPNSLIFNTGNQVNPMSSVTFYPGHCKDAKSLCKGKKRSPKKHAEINFLLLRRCIFCMSMDRV